MNTLQRALDNFIKLNFFEWFVIDLNLNNNTRFKYNYAVLIIKLLKNQNQNKKSSIEKYKIELPNLIELKLFQFGLFDFRLL